MRPASGPVGTVLAEATIGPGGGQLEVPGEVRIAFPAGALDAPERFTISHLIEPSKDVVLYKVEREGERRPLAKPARVSFRLPPEVDGEKAFTVQEIGGHWLGASHGAFDAATRTLSLEVTHFSPEGWMSTLSGETLAKLKRAKDDAVVGGVVVVGAEFVVGGVTLGPAGLVVLVFAAHGWATGVDREMAEKLEGMEGPLPMGGFRIYWDKTNLSYARGTSARYTPDGRFVGFDQPRRDAKGKLLKSAFEGTNTQSLFIPETILTLANQLQDVARWYSLSAIGGRQPIVVRVHGNLGVSRGSTNLGEWDGLTLNVLDTLVDEPARTMGPVDSRPLRATLAHEYWHAIYAERRQRGENVYVDPFPGFEEATAVGFESLQAPDWKQFTEDYQWSDVAAVLRSGLLLAGEGEDDVKRGYDLWPFAKVAFHRHGGGKAIDAFARGALKEGDLDKAFTSLVYSLLTAKDALSERENVRLPYASTTVPTHDCFTGWSALHLTQLVEAGKPLTLGSNPWPAARPLSVRVGIVRVPPRDVRVRGGPLVVRRKAPPPIAETLLAFKPVSAPKDWHPAKSREELLSSLTALVVPKEQVDGTQALILPLAVVGYREADPEFGSPLLAYRLVPPIVKSIGLATDPDSGERRLRVAFEPLAPGQDLEPADCLAGYRLVGRKPGSTDLVTLAEILYTTDHLGDDERSSWHESTTAKKVEIEPGAKVALLPPDTATGYSDLGLQAIDGQVLARGARREPLLSEPMFVAAPLGTISVFVGKTFEEMGRPSGPFQTEPDPVPSAGVSWSYQSSGKPVQGQAQADAHGALRIDNVPLDTAVTVSSRGETKSATCTAQHPQAHVSFGWEGARINPARVPRVP